MGMPITVEIIGDTLTQKDIENIFAYFDHVDKVFSTYKQGSEISKINRTEITPEQYSEEMKEVLELSEETKQQTNGFFNIQKLDGTLDPSGLVKGWAIYKAALELKNKGFQNFYVEAGGDVQAEGLNKDGQRWLVGIRNPFMADEIVKVIECSGNGIATSGTYERGQHIYNPFNPLQKITDIVSLTVIGPNVYEADRFATACFAMGKAGINFLEKQPNLEGYMIDTSGVATMTSGFLKHTKL